MSEFKFACPSCQQRIAADPTWSGQQINCPACKTQITVPAQAVAPAPAPAAPNQAPPPPTPPPKGRLSVTQHAPPEAPAKPVADFSAYGQPRPVAKPGGSSAGKTAGLVIAAIVVFVGLAFAGLKYREHQKAKAAEAAAVADAEAKAAEKAAAAAAVAQAATAKTSTPVTTSAVPAAALTPTAAANRRAVSEAEARYGKNSVTVEPLDDGAVPDPTLIPDKPAFGTVQNESFQITKATYQAGWLTLGEGTGALPDRSVKFNLHVPATESLEGRTFKRPDSKDRRPLEAQAKGKRSTGNYPSGFALNLEFGKKQGFSIPGKIYFSVPNNGSGTMTNIVTGTFTAEMK